MTDPLDVLRADAPAENPPPRFVLELAQRMEREFFDQADQVQAGVPCLVVTDISAAIDFYASAFGAVDIERHRIPDGTIVYAEFRLGAFRCGVAGEEPPYNRSPHMLGGSTVPIDLRVPDVDAFAARAVAAGARVVIPVDDHTYGRSGRLGDPFGHHWIVSTPPRPTIRQEQA